MYKYVLSFTSKVGLENRDINIPIILQMTSKLFVLKIIKTLYKKLDLKSNIIEDDFATHMQIYIAHHIFKMLRSLTLVL